VGDETRFWQQDKAVLFDTSIYPLHQVGSIWLC